MRYFSRDDEELGPAGELAEAARRVEEYESALRHAEADDAGEDIVVGFHHDGDDLGVPISREIVLAGLRGALADARQDMNECIKLVQRGAAA